MTFQLYHSFGVEIERKVGHVRNCEKLLEREKFEVFAKLLVLTPVRYYSTE